jgi:iron complex outermembrane receptor protein
MQNLQKTISTITLTLFLFSTGNAVIGPIHIYDKVALNNSLFNDDDFKATYSSEIYSDKDIAKSGANDIYSFLGQNTSIVTTPSSGNPFSQKINMRGFGLTDGYENIVVTLNGRRLNNIDLVPQFLANIDINNIKKIEVTKGSGSVIYGDGAMAGAIHIWTKDENSSNISISKGSYDSQKVSFNAGFEEKLFSFSFQKSIDNNGGFSNQDSTGHKTKSSNDNQRVVLTLTPLKGTEISLSESTSNVEVRYPNALTLKQFDENPKQTNSIYTVQNYEITNTDFYIKQQLDENLTIRVDRSNESKYSKGKFSSGFVSETNYKNDHTKLFFTYESKSLNVVFGVNIFNNERNSSTNTTHKDNKASFIKTVYTLGKNSFSLGYRVEQVAYKYEPVSGNSLSANHNLTASDIGFNHNLNNDLSFFANYNNGFQAPNVDRFFLYGGTFNKFIEPAKIKTLNLGLNYKTQKSKTKLTVFHSDLTNEIYYYNTEGFSNDLNTNIDKSHKQGLELQHKQQINPQFALNLNYAYTLAKIDEEVENNTTYNNKNLPGVSQDNITLGLDYRFDDKAQINISHKWRSEAYSSEDFANEAEQKQKSFQSTDVSYHYQATEDLEYFFNIQNIFEKHNGIWVRDDAIYPVNFTRNINIGLNYKF